MQIISACVGLCVKTANETSTAKSTFLITSYLDNYGTADIVRHRLTPGTQNVGNETGSRNSFWAERHGDPIPWARTYPVHSSSLYIDNADRHVNVQLFGRFCYSRLLLSRRRKCSRPSLRLTQKRLTQVPHGRVCVYKLDWVPAGWIFSCRDGVGWRFRSSRLVSRAAVLGGWGWAILAQRASSYYDIPISICQFFPTPTVSVPRRTGGDGGHVSVCTSTIAGAQIAMQTADLQTKATAIEDHSSRRLLINSLQFT